ncbi:hypothetical protein [Pseudoalteromonas sp. ND6B]|uniref:hypothetical protein n=1 Tax=Pseudoalteromonas sp. ND6B TaxID=1535421 RepID=UPI00051A4050|nr:hypothetical protein [Pseudoalteromonas sp. ND6B]KGK02584.1 hypothetical protein ND6B_0760 [Pseudoalteromonas sp. ND6B]
MLLTLLGFLIGFFCALSIFITIMVSEIKIDMAVVTNIIIATATTAAVFIQIDSAKKQKQARVWEINKDVLLNLAQSLSKVIDLTDKRISIIESIHYDHVENPETIDSKFSKKVSEDFENSINSILNVYSTIVDENLINQLKNLKNKQLEIGKLYNDDTLTTLEAYEEDLKNYSSLQATLQAFIGRLAGL